MSGKVRVSVVDRFFAVTDIKNILAASSFPVYFGFHDVLGIVAKQAMLSAGLFAASIIGCFVFSDTIGAQSAMLFALAMAVLSFVLFPVLTKKWKNAEIALKERIGNEAVSL